MERDINRIIVVLAEKGGGRETIECLVEGTSEPTSGWQNSWGKTRQLSQSGVPMPVSLRWRHICE